MKFSRRRIPGLSAAMAAVLVFAGCNGGDGTGPSRAGSLEVTTSTTGDDLDPDGYTLAVNDQTESLGINQGVTFAGLTPGAYDVELGDVRANCTVSGSNPQSIAVEADSTSTV